MPDAAKTQTSIRARTVLKADPAYDATPGMLKAGTAALVSSGYHDAGPDDAGKAYAAMISADERRVGSFVEDGFAELRTALGKASKAPWSHDPDHPMAIGTRNALVRGRGRSSVFGISGRGYDDGSAEDAAFVAMARNQLPALLAEYDRLRALVEERACVPDE